MTSFPSNDGAAVYVEAQDHLIRPAARRCCIMALLSLLFILVLVWLPNSESFCGNPLRKNHALSRATFLFSASDDDALQQGGECIDDSRRALFQSTVLASATLFLSPMESLSATPAIGTTPQNPVAILGAGGKSGIEVAQALAKEGLYCVTMSRSGRDPFKNIKLKPEVQSFITHYEPGVNVLDKEGMELALKDVGASGIIYCASASRQGGTAFQVDDDGVGNAAQAASDLKARFILVSALAIDRPNSKSYQITNTLGGNYQGIMDAKLQGEEKVRSILSRTKDYVIVRPGVLLNGVSRNGAIDMEVNQGDMIGGGLTRDELAGVTVGALTSGKKGVTVEVYRRSTATALQPNFTIPSGYEKSSTTYEGLFENVEPDSKMQS
jgi:hypothetical protein